MARDQNDSHACTPPPVAPPPPRRTISWGPLLLILVIGAAGWFINHAEPSVTWDEVMDALGVQNRDRYSRLAVLGLVLVGIAVIARVIRGNGDEE